MGKGGYGALTLNSQTQYVHHLAYELYYGVKAKDWVLHSCNRPSCFNPRHLRNGTASENTIQMYKHGRNGIIPKRINVDVGLASEMLKKGIPAQKICSTLGISLYALADRLGSIRCHKLGVLAIPPRIKRHDQCRKISYEQECQAVALYNNGHTMSEIAREFDVTREAIRHRLNLVR